MRAVLGLVATVTVLALPAAARADAEVCPQGRGDAAYQLRLGPLMSAVTDDTLPTSPQFHAALHRVLGAQYAGLWLDSVRQGWGVAFGPGPLDAASARKAILDHAATRVGGDDLAYLDATLAVVAVPYSEADLQPALEAMRAAQQQDWDIVITGIGCGNGAFRVDVGVGPAETPEVKAKFDALVAPYGDRVAVRYGVPRPTTMPVTVPQDVSQFALLPVTRRYVHGKTIGVTARATRPSRCGQAHARSPPRTAGARGSVSTGERPRSP